MYKSVPTPLLDHQYHDYISVAVDAALAAGEIIRHAFKQPKKVEEKQNHADLVTATDKAAEDLIFNRIRRSFPDHHFIGEESSAAATGGVSEQLGDSPTWMVDPLDGTTNFVHGFPFVCTSIGLAVGRVVVVGVVYNPVLEELFVAAEGGGAYLNGERLAASGRTQLAGAVVGTEVGTSRDSETLDAMFGRMRALAALSRSVRCTGSCALGLCSVALGRCDVFFEINFGGCWDAAAGALMVSEAGGTVLDPAGAPWHVMSRRVLAAGSGELGRAVAAVLGGCKLGSGEAAPPGLGMGPSLRGRGRGEEEGRGEKV
ncbi:hypothetical protein VOLCADRAFT_78931 [Volvox carteri f. nagariensis]|uniref:Inositol-1-monophosphatase n=1 Tax=Volvox carteri f. nagariensis TaxID=3068 RepID=D8TII8_VOLCA|nr:uncharacterized protein VOLCADRAFT_78931 [Volvox carteri f. nagariensis]EFJ52899.1 hypothetical protein VOLCADRAFT_78931 [Volvox carteri f. nagariensis]|eukprot:XP_002945904.1 hypothetical protein VOLCADRAFT_78931 [Volvox carteri f. nagariensis]